MATWPLFCVISPNSVASVANYVKVVVSPSTDFLPRNVISRPTKHDGRAVLFAVAELLVRPKGTKHKEHVNMPIIVLYCIIAFHFHRFNVLYMLRTFNPMFHCICMYVDVWFASVRPK